MTTQVDFNLIPLSTSPYPATSPSVFATTSDQTLAVITTAGACADLVTSGELKVRDVIFVNYDVDGTPGQAVLTVTSTSGGSLIDYNTVSEHNVIAGILSNGGGSTSVTLTNAAITSTSVIVATVAASTNASYVVKVVPGTGSAVITLSADPGTATKISYVIYVAAQ